MERKKARSRIVLFPLFVVGAAALLLGACSRLLEVGEEPTAAPPATTAALAAAPSSTPTTAAATATPTRRPSNTPRPTASPTRTPRPSITPTPAPTLCAHARVTGQTCVAGASVTISSCCPEWIGRTNADTTGRFEFAALTAGTFTVSSGGRSRTVTLERCDSEATVNLCPGPAPTATPPCTPTVSLNVDSIRVRDLRVTVDGEMSWTCAPAHLTWKWGDGHEDSQDFPASHTYAAAGIYDVTVEAANDAGWGGQGGWTWSLKAFVGPNVGDMVYVWPGPFEMGCDSGNPAESCQADEQPLHTVYLGGYFIDTYEVSNARYRACVLAGGCTPPADAGSHTRPGYYGNPAYLNYPVVNVTWAQAQAYCAWAGKDLPTEAQWEKAARGAGDRRAYPWGDAAPSCARLNYKSDAGYCVGDTDRPGSRRAGASPYGVQDMAGNVWEWVADWYGAGYYSASPIHNPAGPYDGTLRVLRGGSWYEDGSWARLARRTYDGPGATYDRLGFRCARAVEP